MQLLTCSSSTPVGWGGEWTKSKTCVEINMVKKRIIIKIIAYIIIIILWNH